MKTASINVELRNGYYEGKNENSIVPDLPTANPFPQNYVIDKELIVSFLEAESVRHYIPKTELHQRLWVYAEDLVNHIEDYGMTDEQAKESVYYDPTFREHLFINVANFWHLCGYYLKSVIRTVDDGEDCAEDVKYIYNADALIDIAEMIAEPMEYAIIDDIAHLGI